MLATGALVDRRYRIEELVGRGGMADVFRAVDTATGTDVAVKRLRGGEPREEARLRSEVRILRLLDHPGIVQLRDGGTDEGVPYLVLDLVTGPSLADLVATGPIGAEQVVTIGEQVAAALAHAHAVGVVHRDVKPSNILLEPSGRARLTDFGIARTADSTHVTASGLVVGSPRYLAPEQVVASDVGPGADVYALGLVLIECLTGEPCFGGGNTETTFARLHRPPAVPDDLPPWLQSLLAAMTAAEPRSRPTAATVAEAFRLRDTGPTIATAAAPVTPTGTRSGDVGWVEKVLVLAGMFILSLLAWQSLGRAAQDATVPPEPTPSSVAPPGSTPPPTVTAPTTLPQETTTEVPVVVAEPTENPNQGKGNGNGGKGKGNSGRGGDSDNDDDSGDDD